MMVTTMLLRSIMGEKIATWGGTLMAATKRGLSTQVLKSPLYLTSLDMPDIWAPSSMDCAPSTSHNYYCEQDAAAVIDGKSIAEEIRSSIASEVTRMRRCIGKVPGLAVILVGQRMDSLTYVRNKIIACEEAGIKSLLVHLPDDCTEDTVLRELSRFNNDSSIHGVLIQLPLPKHLNEEKILNLVNLEKDVDGFHPVHIGNLAMRGREPLFISCTPKGCIELLIRSGVQIMGKHAVVIGRSNIVGLPTSLLLQRHHATVSIVHAFSESPELTTRKGDIIVAAAGVPNLVRGDWLKPGAVVIDVGTCPVEDPSSEFGYRLVGDVCYEEAARIASAITPVPGGVGPMTIAMLLANTLDAAKRVWYDDEEPKEEAGEEPYSSSSSHSSSRRSLKGWLIIVVHATLVLVSQSAAVLLLRLYFVKGGSSKWMATLLQFGGSPILLPYYLYYYTTRQNQQPSNTITTTTTTTSTSLIYVAVGVVNAGCAFLYAIGIQNLPVSTATLISASQLGFIAFFSYFLNSLKLTPFILNSLFLLALSSILVVFSDHNNTSDPNGNASNYTLGFICTLGSAAGNGFLFSMLEYAFRKILKVNKFQDVVTLLMFQGVVASGLVLVGLFVSGDWKLLRKEYVQLGEPVSYVMTLVWCAVTWQVFTVGIIGLVYEVSSLFSNVVAAVCLPLTPILAVVFFHDDINGVKVVSMVVAIWGLLSYLYQQYLDHQLVTGHE
ncbi:Bifunctional protein FolD 1, mitochondrial [Linum grandiflorum]